VRIATWNVNSLKARLERVEDWLQLAALDAEKKKSDALLLNVLPAAIAERLKRCR